MQQLIKLLINRYIPYPSTVLGDGLYKSRPIIITNLYQFYICLNMCIYICMYICITSLELLYKIIEVGGLKQTKVIFSQFWRLKVRDQVAISEGMFQHSLPGSQLPSCNLFSCLSLCAHMSLYLALHLNFQSDWVRTSLTTSF